MGIIKALIENRATGSKTTFANPQEWLETALGSIKSNTGIEVNTTTAMKMTAVFACIRILSETIASLPLFVYRRLKNGGKERAIDHPLYKILHDLPNPHMTSFVWREMQQNHLGSWGNCYSFIERDVKDQGEIIALHPLMADKTKIERTPDRKSYRYVTTIDGVGYEARPDQILHIPGLGFDGLQGYSPIRMASEAIGLGLAAEEFGARFFGNGTHIGGVAEKDGVLNDVAYARLAKQLPEKYGSLGKAHSLLILEDGLKYKPIGIPPEEAQFIATRKFQIAEIARMYRMQLHKLAEMDRATFSNIENQNIEHVVDTIRPWAVRWEQTISWKLFSEKERGVYFAEFLLDGLLRGDTTSRYAAYNIARNAGVINADEWRELENQNPQPDDQGKTYLVPLNMVDAKTVMDGGQQIDMKSIRKKIRKEMIEDRGPKSVLQRKRLSKAYRPKFLEVAGVILKKEISEIRASAEKMLTQRNNPQFVFWLDEFYGNYGKEINDNMKPVITSYSSDLKPIVQNEINSNDDISMQFDKFVKGYIDIYAKRHIDSSRGQLKKIVEETEQEDRDVLEAVNQRLDEWEEKRPEKIARTETVRGENAFAKSIYKIAGITQIISIGTGDNCPYCNELDGKVIGIDRFFIGEGEEFAPGGADPLIPSSDIGHPPYHDGCDCSIMASF